MLLDIELHKKLPAFELNAQLQSDAKRIVVVGPSGSGKSLMLQILTGLLKADSGHICIGNDVWLSEAKCLSAQQRQAGLLFQDYALFPHLTVAQNIGFSLKKGWFNPPKKPNATVEKWLQSMQLERVSNHYPHEISGGQKQRTALARMLITQPKLLLLDEPFSALDADLRRQMRAELIQLQQQSGVPMILITHDQVDADELAEEVWCMENGCLRRI